MRTGDRVADRWVVERMAGAGGMSAVYCALDPESGERVAIKVIPRSTPEISARFEREARMLAELEHPSILRYLAHGSLGSGGSYLVTEWLEGEDLGQRLRNKQLTHGESVALVERVAEALAPAHRRGIVHRDIKPPNIFLVDRDLRRVKLLDFGIARFASAALDLTSPGVAVGTPSYMSPEQASGLSIGVRADVFALGALLFKLVTGRTPFAGKDHMAVLMKVVLEDAPRLSSLEPRVAPDLDALCARLLSRPPEARPRDASAVIEEIRALDVASRRAPSAGSEPPGLGTEERRLVSLVLVRHALPPQTSIPTPPPRDEDEDEELATRVELGAPAEDTTAVAPAFGAAARDGLERTLRRIARAHAARLHRLADGTVVLTSTGSEVATDLASRAARAAIDLRSELPRRTIALATGMSESGDVATIGDVIDRAIDALHAARVPDAAADAPIVLDDVSAALLEHRFVLGRAGQAATLVRARDAVDAPRQLLGRPTVFVGRDREMALLEAAIEESIDEPVARAAIVTGPPGSGKTRLRHELLERLAARVPHMDILEAGGDPLRAGSAFGLLATALRRRFGLHAGDPAARQHSRLATVVSDVLLGEERDRVVTFLAEMIGVPLPDANNVQLRAARQSPLLMGDQIRRAWHDYLLAVTQARPLMIVLDDLQWGDLPSVRLVESALATLRDRPLMVVALGRTEVRALFPGLWVGRGSSELGLGPLSRRACEAMARAALGDAIDRAELDAIVARSDGNAFFLEELLRSRAEGRLDALPETVLATLQSRLSSLESDARRILRAAAVLGPTFWTGGVHALLGRGDALDAVHVWLRHLTEHEWIAPRPSSSIEGETEWCFPQSFVRDAAYATLTEEDRRRGHRLAGEWLAGHGANDAIALAEHFERGAHPAAALPAFVEAVRHSLEGDDLEGALDRARRGLACAAALHDVSVRVPTGMLELARAEAHRWRGENVQAAEAASRALEKLPPRSSSWFFALAESATAHGRIDDHDRLLAMVGAFHPLPARETSVDAFCIAASRAAIALTHRGRHEEADVIVDAAERAAACAPVRGPQGEAAIAVARNAQAHGRLQPAAALAWALRAVSELDRAGDRRSACMQRVNVGWSYLVLGRYADAIVWLRAALETALSLRLEDSAAMARQNLGLALALAGEADEALGVLRAAIDAFGRQQNRVMDATARVYLALALETKGALDAAELECRGAVLMSNDMPATRCVALGRLASILRAQGRSAAAHAAALGAMAALREAGRVQEGEMQVRLEHVLVLHDRGEHDEAASELAELARRLHEHASEMDDPVLAESFLHNVEEHAHVLRLSQGR